MNIQEVILLDIIRYCATILESIHNIKMGNEESEVADKLMQVVQTYNKGILEYMRKLEVHTMADRGQYVMSEAGDKLMREVNGNLAVIMTEIQNNGVQEKVLNYSKKFTREEIQDMIESNETAIYNSDLPLKYEFVMNYFNSINNVPEDEITLWKGNLEKCYYHVCKGNSDAITRLNETFNEVLRVYPKDDVKAQYNLGVYYKSIGNSEEAIKWFSKSAKNGSVAAKFELLYFE